MSSATSSAVPSPTGQPAHHAPHQNAVAAFIIGLAIVTLASVLNAAGLNLTKLDHVRVLCVRERGHRRCAGPDERDTQGVAAQGLAAPVVAARHAIIHVGVAIRFSGGRSLTRPLLPVCPN
jgi:hypothetical protein